MDLLNVFGITLSFTCQVCVRRRGYDKLQITSMQVSSLGANATGVRQINVTHCNDNAHCKKIAGRVHG